MLIHYNAAHIKGQRGAPPFPVGKKSALGKRGLQNANRP
ncbi:hypothetical protein NMH_0890 [Neisseria meningitidis H44/76]|uniref:Uncharacterized protein n=1 Tax=Neisseria meningitidis serogroup B / serotype 15 (strain H44/76) TaxID=909420 RepID=E6MW52_NEIMH|nr:hypothetical protein NMH_0890 [Neisseria meningitidis H44/76]